jgi:hypothetical protein
MRPISGFDRPGLQWLFVALSVLLIAVAGGAAWVARQANAAAETARSAEEGSRLERQHLDAQLARERSSREALTLELSRAREGTSEPVRVMPTLTLEPVTTRGASPPAATVATQHATQLIELRLVLPAAAKPHTRFEAVLRDWTTGRLVWSRGGLAASTVDRQSMLATFVTGDLFRPGAYELLVSGVGTEGQKTEVASYEVAFR